MKKHRINNLKTIPIIYYKMSNTDTPTEREDICLNIVIVDYYNEKERESLCIWGKPISQTIKTITIDYDYLKDEKGNKHTIWYDEDKHKHYYIKYIGDTLNGKKVYLPNAIRKYLTTRIRYL